MRGLILFNSLVLHLCFIRPAVAHDGPVDLHELRTGYVNLLKNIHDIQTGQLQGAPDSELAPFFGQAVSNYLELRRDLGLASEKPESDKIDPADVIQLQFRYTRWLIATHSQYVRAKYKLAQFLSSEETIPLNELGVAARQLMVTGFKRGGGAMTEVFARHGVTYGIVWAVATATFEILEHGPLQIHIGCAAFQTSFHLVGSAVLSTYRVGLNPCGDASPMRRLLNSFRSNYLNWKHWWRPSLPWAPPRLLADLEQVFSEGEQGVWIASQHAALLDTLLSTLRTGAQERNAEFSATQYLYLKRLLGKIGQSIDDYKAALISASLAKEVDEAFRKKEVLQRKLSELLSLFQRPEILAIISAEQALPTSDQLKKLSQEIDAASLKKEIRRLTSTQPAVPGSCPTILVGASFAALEIQSEADHRPPLYPDLDSDGT